MKKQFFALALLLSISGITFCSEAGDAPQVSHKGKAKEGLSNNQKLAATAAILCAGCYLDATRELAFPAAIGFDFACIFSLVRKKGLPSSEETVQPMVAGAIVGAAYKWVPPFRGFANGILPAGWGRP